MDELMKVPGSPYSIALPRVLMLSRNMLKLYADTNMQAMRDYVDEQEVCNL